MTLRQALRKQALSIPLGIYQRLLKRDYVALYYHVISDAPLATIKHLYAFKSQAAFEDDLKYLKAHFNCISYAQLESYQRNGASLPKNACILTFDDGLSQCFSTARPLLLKHNIPCIFFVTTDFLDNRGLAADMKASLCIEKFQTAKEQLRQHYSQTVAVEFGADYLAQTTAEDWIKSLAGNNPEKVDILCELLEIDIRAFLTIAKPYLSSEEVMQLHADGFTIGAHSLRHERLSELSPQGLENNIVQSCQAVRNLTGAAHIPFAFPFSADGIPRQLLQEIRTRHPFVGFYFAGNGIVSECDFIVPRFCGDSPASSKPGHSNLNKRIANAYLEALSSKFSRPAAMDADRFRN
ncbi:MAG: polysaccharide deacetylase family protein [Anaerolineaceae bacterium]